MTRISLPGRAAFQAEAPRPDRLTSIGEALEEVLGAYAGRVAGRGNARAGHSAATPSSSSLFEGSMMAFGSLSTR